MSHSRHFRRPSYSRVGQLLVGHFLGNLGRHFLGTTTFNKCNALVFLGVLSAVVFFGGVDDEEAINMYIQELQTLSEHHIKRDQKRYVRRFYTSNKNRSPLRKERYEIRREFESKKRKLKSQWESRYSLKWPSLVKAQAQKEINRKTKCCLQPIDSDNNVSVVRERAYEAHHIIPINAGGINSWWNITPLNPRNHAILHGSIEEKACFSHDFLHRTIMRFLLRLQSILQEIFGKYINKKGTNYASESFL